MHYLIQSTLAELEAATLDVFDGVAWVKSWQVVGGDKYIGLYENGQAVIAGPLIIGNPSKEWFEVQCSEPGLVAELGAVGNSMSLMKSEMRTNALLRASYRVSIALDSNSRSLIRDSVGRIVGVTPDFVICGTHPASSFMAGEGRDTADEIGDLE